MPSAISFFNASNFIAASGVVMICFYKKMPFAVETKNCAMKGLRKHYSYCTKVCLTVGVGNFRLTANMRLTLGTFICNLDDK